MIDDLADDAVAGFDEVDDDLIRDVPDLVAELDELDLDVSVDGLLEGVGTRTSPGRTTRCGCT